MVECGLGRRCRFCGRGMFHPRGARFSGGSVERLTRRGVAGRKASGQLRDDFVVAGEGPVDRAADGTGGGTGDDIIGDGAQQAWAAGAGHEDRAQDAGADPGVCLGHHPGRRNGQGGSRCRDRCQETCNTAFAVHGMPSC